MPNISSLNPAAVDLIVRDQRFEPLMKANRSRHKTALAEATKLFNIPPARRNKIVVTQVDTKREK
jgi:hypothetical protein